MTLRVILGIIIGGTIGFALGYFGRCVSGTCPLTSNPYVSAIIGALIGLLITMGR